MSSNLHDFIDIVPLEMNNSPLKIIIEKQNYTSETIM